MRPQINRSAELPTEVSIAAQQPLSLVRDQAIHLAGLEDNIGLHVGIGHALLVQKLDPKLKDISLTAKQVTIMWLVDANPEISQSEISRFLCVERATIHQFTRSLVMNGLIEVEKSRIDGRSSRMELTGEGRKALAAAREIIVSHEIEATAKLSMAERGLLLDLLQKLIGTKQAL